ncbi:MAG: hypothetical protein K0M45_11605 [Candidatus Paracaedibacteraceae bacterium]|nr:hypothetical protein [Candidatus Paracaedibacteraceae bacterium]
MMNKLHLLSAVALSVLTAKAADQENLLDFGAQPANPLQVVVDRDAEERVAIEEGREDAIPLLVDEREAEEEGAQLGREPVFNFQLPRAEDLVGGGAGQGNLDLRFEQPRDQEEEEEDENAVNLGAPVQDLQAEVEEVQPRYEENFDLEEVLEEGFQAFQDAVERLTQTIQTSLETLRNAQNQDGVVALQTASAELQRAMQSFRYADIVRAVDELEDAGRNAGVRAVQAGLVQLRDLFNNAVQQFEAQNMAGKLGQLLEIAEEHDLRELHQAVQNVIHLLQHADNMNIMEAAQAALENAIEQLRQLPQQQPQALAERQQALPKQVVTVANVHYFGDHRL